MKRGAAGAAVLVGLSLIASCGSSSGSSGGKGLAAWRQAGGRERVGQMISDRNAFNDVAGNSDVSDTSSTKALVVAASCKVILDDARAGMAFQPIPDRNLQTDWSSVLAYYAEGGDDCHQGITGGDVDRVHRSASEFQQAESHFTPALKQLAQPLG